MKILKTFTKVYDNEIFFNNAVEMSKVMYDIGVGPKVIHAQYPFLTTKYIKRYPPRDNFYSDVKILVDIMHNAGYCHGDLHLDNIIPSKNRVYLIDFDYSFKISDAENNKFVLEHIKWLGWDNVDTIVQCEYDQLEEESDVDENYFVDTILSEELSEDETPKDEFREIYAQIR